MKLLDQIPLVVLIAGTVFMLGAPFVPEPHLVAAAARRRTRAPEPLIDLL